MPLLITIKMPDNNLLHLRISKNLMKELDKLVDKGLFSNKNEVIREAIRNSLLKYKDELIR